MTRVIHCNKELEFSKIDRIDRLKINDPFSILRVWFTDHRRVLVVALGEYDDRDSPVCWCCRDVLEDEEELSIAKSAYQEVCAYLKKDIEHRMSQLPEVVQNLGVLERLSKAACVLGREIGEDLK